MKTLFDYNAIWSVSHTLISLCLVMACAPSGSGSRRPVRLEPTPASVKSISLSQDENTSSTAFAQQIDSPNRVRDGDLTFRIITNAQDDFGFFNVEDDGTLRFADSFTLDHEEKAGYRVSVRSEDATGVLVTSVTLTVNDLNDVAPVFEPVPAANFTVDEGSVFANRFVATADIEGGTIRYQISGQDEEYFDINTGTGQVTSKRTTIFEADGPDPKTTYEFTITATALAPDGNLSADSTFTLRVIDINDEPPVFTSPAMDIVAERDIVAENDQGFFHRFVATPDVATPDVEGHEVRYQINGGSGDDELDGSVGTEQNRLYGGAGADTLHGNHNDYLDGGSGYDTASFVRYTQEFADDVVTDLVPYVTVNLTTGVASYIGVAANGRAGDADVVYFYQNARADSTLRNIENVIGSDGGDTITGNRYENSVEGGKGADTMSGGNGNDTLSYASSDAAVNVSLTSYHDTEIDENGFIVLTGAGGDAEGDRIKGFESLIGSVHNDTLEGNGYAQTIPGGAGDDTITLGAGTKQIIYRFTSDDNGNWTGSDGSDVIHNFTRGVDKLLFTDTNANGIDSLADFVTQAQQDSHLGITLLQDASDNYTGLVFNFDETNKNGMLQINFDNPLSDDLVTDLGLAGTSLAKSQYQYLNRILNNDALSENFDITTDVTPSDLDVL